MESAQYTATDNLNGLRVELHGHAGVDTNGMKDVTQFVTSIRIGHAVNPPWDTMTIGLALPRHLLDLILTGDAGTGGHRHVHTGGWVVVRASAGTGDKHVGRPALGFGCVEHIKFAFQDIGGIADVPVQGTTIVMLECISWFQAAGRSNIRLALTDEKTTYGGVQDVTEWYPIIAEAIKNSTSTDLGYALEQLWSKVSGMITPDTLCAALFGTSVPVVYNAHLAGNYAPDRAGAVLPVRGQGFLNLPVINPESDLWQWLSATFVPDANIVELFPSLEYPHLGPGDKKHTPVMSARQVADPSVPVAEKDLFLAEEGTSPPVGGAARSAREAEGADRFGESTVPRRLLTDLGNALGGANPVLMYRLKPYLMHPIDEKTWGRPTMSEKLKVNQIPVDPHHVGVAAQWYMVQDSEALSMDVEYSESERVNLTFARPTYMQTGAFRAYTQIGQVVMPQPADFNRYGLRAYEPLWPFIPEGTPVERSQAQAWANPTAGGATPGSMLHVPSLAPTNAAAAEANLIDDFTAMGELVWSLCGSAERFAHATLRTRAKPWCRAGHWISGSLGAPANGGPVTYYHWTGYIEAVEHTFEIDKQARLHTGSVFRLARVSFSKGSSNYYTPVDNPEQELAGDDKKRSGTPSVSKEYIGAKLPKGKISKGSAAQTRAAWVKEFTELARPICAAKGFPLSMCVAMAAHETIWGAYAIGSANNYFGIKASGSDKFVLGSTKEHFDGKSVGIVSKFKVFASKSASIQGYVDKLAAVGRWTPPVANPSVGSRILWVWGTGYATDPDYISKVQVKSAEIAGLLGDPSMEIVYTGEQKVVAAQLRDINACTTVKGKKTWPRSVATKAIGAAGTWPQ